MRYRKEIDGLRALAVIPVILFHAGFKMFSGGFVGVDIFFVISGYLITTIILTEKEAGTFSFINFYERRARRILPALFFVMLCCLPFAWLWMFPDQLRAFAKSLVAVSIFCSNFFFQQGTGYFAPSAEEIPLLHTWSLAVEEQYYVIFPMFVILFWRFGKDRIFSLIILAAIVSLGLTEWLSHNASYFYSSPLRVWEILVGAICAIHLLKKGDHKGNQWLSLLGIGLIIFAIAEFDRNTPFPSLYTLIPVLGTAIIILFSTQKTIVARVLSTPIFVGIGLISYSAYLWHYPLFAFARIRSLNDPSLAHYFFLSVLALGLGWLTWRFIEQPFRNKRENIRLLSRKKLTQYAVGGASFFVIIGVIGNNSNGFESRFSDDVLSILYAKKHARDDRFKCSKGNKVTVGITPCVYDLSHPVIVALLGDSHAGQLALNLGKELASSNMGLVKFTGGGCPPFRKLTLMPGSIVVPRCKKITDNAFKYLQSSPVTTVVLANRWTIGIEGSNFDNFEGGKGHHQGGFDVLGHVANDSEDARKIRVASRYTKGIEEILLLGKKVILVYPIPEAGWNVPEYLAKASMQGKDFGGMLSTSYEIFKSRSAATYSALDAIYHPNLIRVKPGDIFCDSYVKGRCLNQLNGVPLYTDDHHLSRAGVRLVVDRIVHAIHSTH